MWRTASSVPWKKNMRGNRVLEQKMYKKMYPCFLSTVAGRHVWRTVKIEISDLKKLFGSCLVGLQM